MVKMSRNIEIIDALQAVSAWGDRDMRGPITQSSTQTAVTQWFGKDRRMWLYLLTKLWSCDGVFSVLMDGALPEVCSCCCEDGTHAFIESKQPPRTKRGRNQIKIIFCHNLGKVVSWKTHNITRYVAMNGPIDKIMKIWSSSDFWTLFKWSCKQHNVICLFRYSELSEGEKSD